MPSAEKLTCATSPDPPTLPKSEGAPSLEDLALVSKRQPPPLGFSTLGSDDLVMLPLEDAYMPGAMILLDLTTLESLEMTISNTLAMGEVHYHLQAWSFTRMFLPSTSSQGQLEPSPKIKELWAIIMLLYIMETPILSTDQSKYPLSQRSELWIKLIATLLMKWILDGANTSSPSEVNFRSSEYPLSTEENHLSQSTNLKITRIDKTWTSNVNRLDALIFIHSWIYSCTHFTYFTLLYIFLYMFGIKHTLVDLTWGCIKVPGGECHSVHLELPFPSSWWRGNQSIHFGILLRVATSTQVTRCKCRLSCQKWTWHHQSVIWWCTNDVGLLDDDIYVISASGLGV